MLQGVFIVKVVDMISVLSHSGQLMAEGSESSESESDLLHLNMDDMSVQSGILWITFATVEKEKLSTHGKKFGKKHMTSYRNSGQYVQWDFTCLHDFMVISSSVKIEINQKSTILSLFRSYCNSCVLVYRFEIIDLHLSDQQHHK